MAGGTFPTSLPTYTITAGAETANSAGGGTGLSGLLNQFEVDVTALATKLGSGAATASNKAVLVGSGSGTSTWSTTLDGLTFTTAVLSSPTIANFTNAAHDHSNATNGGNINVTSPKVTTAINDTNNNKIIGLNPVASAVNYPQADNATATGTPVVGFEAVGSNTNIHFQAIAKGSGLTKVSILRKNNTTDTYNHNSIVLTGWGFILGTASSFGSKTVTFGITFAATPIVLSGCIGFKDTTDPTNSGDFGQWEIPNVNTGLITTTGFNAIFGTIDAAAVAATRRVGFGWIAEGEL
jgi:hypothetical protein